MRVGIALQILCVPDTFWLWCFHCSNLRGDYLIRVCVAVPSGVLSLAFLAFWLDFVRILWQNLVFCSCDAHLCILSQSLFLLLFLWLNSSSVPVLQSTHPLVLFLEAVAEQCRLLYEGEGEETGMWEVIRSMMNGQMVLLVDPSFISIKNKFSNVSVRSKCYHLSSKLLLHCYLRTPVNPGVKSSHGPWPDLQHIVQN